MQKCPPAAATVVLEGSMQTKEAHFKLVSGEAEGGRGGWLDGAREQLYGALVVVVPDLHLRPLAPHMAEVISIEELCLHVDNPS
jgi:hypothetical protein